MRENIIFAFKQLANHREGIQIMGGSVWIEVNVGDFFEDVSEKKIFYGKKLKDEKINQKKY